MMRVHAGTLTACVLLAQSSASAAAAGPANRKPIASALSREEERVIGKPPADNARSSASPHLVGQSRQMMGGVAKAVLENHAPAEIVAHRIFLGHADAAMQL